MFKSSFSTACWARAISVAAAALLATPTAQIHLLLLLLLLRVALLLHHVQLLRLTLHLPTDGRMLLWSAAWEPPHCTYAIRRVRIGALARAVAKTGLRTEFYALHEQREVALVGVDADLVSRHHESEKYSLAT